MTSKLFCESRLEWRHSSTGEEKCNAKLFPVRKLFYQSFFRAVVARVSLRSALELFNQDLRYAARAGKAQGTGQVCRRAAPQNTRKMTRMTCTIKVGSQTLPLQLKFKICHIYYPLLFLRLMCEHLHTSALNKTALYMNHLRDEFKGHPFHF